MTNLRGKGRNRIILSPAGPCPVHEDLVQKSTDSYQDIGSATKITFFTLNSSFLLYDVPLCFMFLSSRWTGRPVQAQRLTGRIAGPGKGGTWRTSHNTSGSMRLYPINSGLSVDERNPLSGLSGRVVCIDYIGRKGLPKIISTYIIELRRRIRAETDCFPKMAQRRKLSENNEDAEDGAVGCFKLISYQAVRTVRRRQHPDSERTSQNQDAFFEANCNCS
jgi:hypothetical protein